MKSRKIKIIFIVNPISGARRRPFWRNIINNVIDKKKFDYKIELTKYAGHAKEIAADAVKNKIPVVVAVGGDGTINEVGSQLIGSDTALGIIPLGSGNGLARHLGIPRILPLAIRLINQMKITEIDTAEINGVPFISIAGVGFDALVAKLFAKSSARGFLTYARIVANRFAKYKPKKYVIKTKEGEKIKTKAFFISFANSNQFGFNTAIAPNASLKDGFIDICIVKKPNFFELPIVANLLMLRMIDKSPLVRIIKSAEFTVKQEKNRHVNIDGEAVKISKELHVKVNPLSLKIIVPTKYGKK